MISGLIVRGLTHCPGVSQRRWFDSTRVPNVYSHEEWGRHPISYHTLSHYSFSLTGQIIFVIFVFLKSPQFAVLLSPPLSVPFRPHFLLMVRKALFVLLRMLLFEHQNAHRRVLSAAGVALNYDILFYFLLIIPLRSLFRPAPNACTDCMQTAQNCSTQFWIANCSFFRSNFYRIY